MRRTPPKRPAPETNAEEGSISFRGFVPKVSSTRGTRALQSFHLRDEPSSKASHNVLEANLGYQDVSGTTSHALARAELTPEASLEPVRRRVKHMDQIKKFGPQERLAGIISGGRKDVGQAGH